MDYQARLDAVNTAADERSVLDSIDRPIRGLVQQMNAHGIRTKFSCCGFGYDGEEEPKSHSNEGPFVVFEAPSPHYMHEHLMFHAFVLAAKNCGWNIDMYHADPQNVLWTVRYEMQDRQKNFYQQTPGMKGIHDYEMPLIAIKRLEKALASRPGLSEYTIRDGNSTYGALDGEWQIKPKKDFVFKHEEATVIEPANAVSV